MIILKFKMSCTRCKTIEEIDRLHMWQKRIHSKSDEYVKLYWELKNHFQQFEGREEPTMYKEMKIVLSRNKMFLNKKNRRSEERFIYRLYNIVKNHKHLFFTVTKDRDVSSSSLLISSSYIQNLSSSSFPMPAPLPPAPELSSKKCILSTSAAVASASSKDTSQYNYSSSDSKIIQTSSSSVSVVLPPPPSATQNSTTTLSTATTVSSRRSPTMTTTLPEEHLSIKRSLTPELDPPLIAVVSPVSIDAAAAFATAAPRPPSPILSTASPLPSSSPRSEERRCRRVINRKRSTERERLLEEATIYETVATASHAQASSSTNPLSISEKDLKIEVDEEKIYDLFTGDYIDYPNNGKKARIGEGIPTKVTSVKQEDDPLEVETITVKKETDHDIAEYVSVDQIKMESEMSF